MLMATKTARWTRADLERLPDDGNRYEVLDGRLLVTPQASPRHQDAAFFLGVTLRAWCERHGIGAVVGPGAVVWDDNELQPDVVVIPGPTRLTAEKWDDLPRAILVVEVLSTSTRSRDLSLKRRAYLRLRIPEYWVVDRFDHRVLVWRPDAGEAVVVTDVIKWQPRADLPPLEIALDSVLPPSRPDPVGD
ncbi:MAG TPA: Uma2 family endonuclease [Gemmatimonadaceae bacterium]